MTKENFKSFVKSINLFEVVWLSLTIASLIVLSVLFPDIMFEDRSNTLVVVCSMITIIFGPVVEVLISKQCRYWTMFSLFLVELLQCVVYINLKLYSSVLINILFWAPIDIITFIKWGKNKDEERKDMTEVKTLGTKGNIIAFIIMCTVGFLLGFIFKLLPNSEISYVIAFSNVFEVSNGIFLLTRYDEQWLAWLGYLVCETIIWVMLGHYIMLITVFSMLINTIYGFVKWKVYIKKSKLIKAIAKKVEAEV